MNKNSLRQKAEWLRLLAHPTRLALLANLLDGPLCVTDIQDLLEVKQANVSQHLAVLRQAQLIFYHEDGKTRCYYLACPRLVRQLMKFLNEDYPVIERSPKAVKRAAHRRQIHKSTHCTIKK